MTFIYTGTELKFIIHEVKYFNRTLRLCIPTRTIVVPGFWGLLLYVPSHKSHDSSFLHILHPHLKDESLLVELLMTSKMSPDALNVSRAVALLE